MHTPVWAIYRDLTLNESFFHRNPRFVGRWTVVIDHSDASGRWTLKASDRS